MRASRPAVIGGAATVLTHIYIVLLFRSTARPLPRSTAALELEAQTVFTRGGRCLPHRRTRHHRRSRQTSRRWRGTMPPSLRTHTSAARSPPQPSFCALWRSRAMPYAHVPVISVYSQRCCGALGVSRRAGWLTRDCQLLTPSWLASCHQYTAGLAGDTTAAVAAAAAGPDLNVRNRPSRLLLTPAWRGTGRPRAVHRPKPQDV